MDTRRKIVSLERAQMQLADGRWLLVAGHFDPLTAAAAERLADLAEQGSNEKVLAVVLDGSDTLLNAEARSFLVAALRTVDLVVVLSEDLVDLLPRSERIRFVFDREADARSSAEFSALVLGKERPRLPASELDS